jgi:hypothetical protein
VQIGHSSDLLFIVFVSVVGEPDNFSFQFKLLFS